MNPEIIAAEIVDKLPELVRDSRMNAHEFVAGLIRQAVHQAYRAGQEAAMKSQSIVERLAEKAAEQSSK